MSLRTKAVGVTAVAVIGGLMLSGGIGLPGKSDPEVDTSKRRGYTLLADSWDNRATIEVHVISNVRGTILLIEERNVATTWKDSFWVEPNEIVSIDLDVWSRKGTNKIGSSVWSRCQILFNGGMAGGDAEIDNFYVRNDSDRRRQAYSACTINAG